MFYTQFGENRPTGSKQVFTQPSMTEPDNTMSIPEIIARYTRGQGLGVNQRVWQSGTATEEGESEVPQDGTLEQLLELPTQPAEPAKPEPSAVPAPAAAPAAPAAAPAAASAEPAPTPAPPAGA